MGEYVEQVRSAIYQCERGLVFNAYEIGRHLFDLSVKGVNLKEFVEAGSHSFGYERGMAFKRLYEYSKSGIVSGAESLVKQIGVDKSLELLEPLKEFAGEFLLRHGVEEIKKMSGRQLRCEVGKFKTEIGEKGVKTRDFEAFFLKAEDGLRDAVLLLEGAGLKHPVAFREWSGRVRLLRLLDRLKRVLE